VIPGGSGSDSYSLKMMYKGKETGTRYMDRPPVKFITDGMTLTGTCLLLITSDAVDGHSAVRVSAV